MSHHRPHDLPNDLSAFWLPFTPNRHFKSAPRMLVRAEGMYFYDERAASCSMPAPACGA